MKVMLKDIASRVAVFELCLITEFRPVRGNIVKLRGHPKAPPTKPGSNPIESLAARLIASGRVITEEMIQWVIRSQVPLGCAYVHSQLYVWV